MSYMKQKVPSKEINILRLQTDANDKHSQETNLLSINNKIYVCKLY